MKPASRLSTARMTARTTSRRATSMRTSLLSQGKRAVESHQRDEVAPGVGREDGGVMDGRVVYVGHATVLLELDGVRLLTDPVLRGRVLHLRRRVPPPAPLGDLGAILISHVHYDHLDVPSLKSLDPGVPVVAPWGTRRAFRRFRDVRELRVGEETRLGDVTVRAVPAVHDSARLPFQPSLALGFVVSGSRSVYFAGDTDLFAGMADIADDLDVALVPVAGWGPKVGPGHLDPN